MHRNDAIDVIIEQWQQELPELDTRAMATVGRLKRCSALLQPKLDTIFSEFTLSSWEFDVLATLLRSGSPYCLAPTQLFSMLMITSGTMTHRMSRLEQRGFISREVDINDARSKRVKLTEQGEALIRQAVTEHVKNEESILSKLDSNQRGRLDEALKILLDVLE